MKLLVKRSQWLRGEGSEKSYLCRSSDMKMCCLGFLAIECRAHLDGIKNRFNPSHVSDLPWPEGILTDNYDDSIITCKLMEINDDDCIIDSVRESLLKEQFAKLNIQLEFEES